MDLNRRWWLRFTYKGRDRRNEPAALHGRSRRAADRGQPEGCRRRELPARHEDPARALTYEIEVSRKRRPMEDFTELFFFLRRCLRRFLFFKTSTDKRVVQPVIAFVTRVLKNRADGFRHWKFRGPRPNPGRLIFNRKRVIDRIVGHTREAFDHAHIGAGVVQRILSIEILRFEFDPADIRQREFTEGEFGDLSRAK